MTQPSKREIDDYSGPSEWTPWNLIGYSLAHNGVFVTFCIIMICYLVYNQREDKKDAIVYREQMAHIIVNQTAIMAELNTSVRENDRKDSMELQEMKPVITGINSDLRDIRTILTTQTK
jgi:hypothetical protein